MKKYRQDAWTEEEDALLANIVLTYIRNGKTQLDAFKRAGEALSRTAAACGFRWNATIRKKKEKEIEEAKAARKKEQARSVKTIYESEKDALESAISTLERMKQKVATYERELPEKTKSYEQLVAENERLKKQLKRYEEAWQEMNKLWEWTKNEH